ncbi:MAG: alpha/beta fold hydrolase [Acidimicrobiia bacterium]|nr:alpha/beta fold hydrolase [Acidimicrobiia bacterium]
MCIHGEPTWGYLYRDFIPRLVRQGRVVVPDHMGFGKSETPRERSYSTREHAENMERLLVEHLNLTNITLVLQDWGGSIGSAFALRNPDRVDRVCVCNTIVMGSRPEGIPGPLGHPWFNWTLTDQYEPTIRNLGSTVLSVMKRIGFERTAHIDETWIRAYSAPFPTPEDCIGAYQFPRNIAAPETAEFMLETIEAAGGTEVLASKPAIGIFGEEDRAIPVDYAVASFKGMFPNGPVVRLPGVGHFLQEDAPEAVASMIELFIQSS